MGPWMGVYEDYPQVTASDEETGVQNGEQNLSREENIEAQERFTEGIVNGYFDVSTRSWRTT